MADMLGGNEMRFCGRVRGLLGRAILVAAACLFAAQFVAQNAWAGETTQKVVNKAPNGLAQTPPMGWNSWNKFACNVDEKTVRAARAMNIRTR